jgi:PAS domain S-box-containing protein
MQWSWNVATDEVSWEPGIEVALFGLPAGSFAGTFDAYLALVHPEDRAHFRAVIERTMAGEDEYVMAHRVVWPDGSVRWVDCRGRLTRDEQGRPLLLTGVVWSQSAQKSAEGRLMHLQRVRAVAGAVSRELLRVRCDDEAFERACTIAVDHGDFRFAWVGSLEGTGVHLTPLARAGFHEGYLEEIEEIVTEISPGALRRTLGEGRAVIINDIANNEAFRPWRALALRRGYGACGAFPLRRHGEVVGALIIYSAEANRFDADQIELLTGLTDDIGFKLDALDAEARREAAEQAMQRSEERYRALVEQAADAIFLADADDAVLEVNVAGCEMSGYTRDELLGRKLTSFLDPSYPGNPPLPPELPAGIRIAGERRALRKDGSVFDVELTATALEDGRLLGYARDVTKRNLMQRQLVLADRLASLGRLAAGVAHEINNPLAYVATSLAIIERAAGASPPTALVLDEIATAAAAARDGVDRVRSVVRSLGSLSRDDEGAVRAVDVHAVLDGAVRLTEGALRERGRVVRAYGATRPARGNELRLGQVFVNLLVNARDALPGDTPARNEIVLRTRDEADSVVVEVHDNGVGIAPEDLGRVFDPFFTTKPVGEGTGLGLAISHGIIASLGGRIAVQSGPERGTTFRVTLPAEAVRPSLAPPPHAHRAPERALELLVVDDEVNLAHSLARLLEDHQVTIATGGAEGLALCRERRFDCVLCDLMMPGVSGMDLYEELARRGDRSERRVIFMTGGACSARAAAFLARTPNGVLEKPFSLDCVEQVIGALVKQVALEARSPGRQLDATADAAGTMSLAGG